MCHVMKQLMKLRDVNVSILVLSRKSKDLEDALDGTLSISIEIPARRVDSDIRSLCPPPIE